METDGKLSIYKKEDIGIEKKNTVLGGFNHHSLQQISNGHLNLADWKLRQLTKACPPPSSQQGWAAAEQAIALRVYTM